MKSIITHVPGQFWPEVIRDESNDYRIIYLLQGEINISSENLEKLKNAITAIPASPRKDKLMSYCKPLQKAA